MTDVRTTVRPLTRSEAAGYAGDAVCARCHAEVFWQQSTSRHAHTLRRVSFAVDGSLFRRPGTVRDPAQNILYRALIQGNNCFVSEQSPSRQRLLTADWVIGSGRNGRTFFSQLDADLWLDIRVSYYTRPRVWDFTPMQQPSVNQHEDPDGIILSGPSLFGCIRCHATVVRLGPSGLDVAHSQLGVGCERCHGPGRRHVDEGAAMEDLSTFSQSRLTGLCGACHGLMGTTSFGGTDTADQLPRLAAPALAKSRCFRESHTLTCVTCHDPHRDATGLTKSTEAACRSCHTQSRPAEKSTPETAHSASAGRVCPVNPVSGCVSCHMPRQGVPNVPHTLYTNHWIRVWSSAALAPGSNRVNHTLPDI